MSYGAGHANGHDDSTSRERRPTGYGGFGYNGDDTGGSARSRDQELAPSGGHWRRRADRGDRDYSNSRRDRSRGDRSHTNGTRGPRKIEAVLEDIQRDWGVMTSDQCIPVQIALQLMDTSSLGRAADYYTFLDQHKQLQRSLKEIVNQHHQGFNSSIGTFHKIETNIAASQTKVRNLRASLSAAKTGLSTTKPELKGLASTSQGYDDMLQVLAKIEQLQGIQEKLDTRITEKRFLTAVDILQDGLRLITKPEMENIGALNDLRTYLTNQQTSLKEILVEELHSHLYLKSPYCQDRWKTYDQNQTKTDEANENPKLLSGPRALYLFLEGLDVSSPMIEDASRNPEADSFYYIQLLVESLNKTGGLETAVQSIHDRLPIELHELVDRTNQEVDGRHPSTLRGSTRQNRNKLDLILKNNDIRANVIHDLLWTLYAKFEAIAEGHRVLHDVVTGILKREKIRKLSLTEGFRELWKIYQNEIKKLLHDYLATDNVQTYGLGQMQLRNGNVFFSLRDRTMKMFKMTNIDSKDPTILTEQEDLEMILKPSVPGLLANSKRPANNSSTTKGQHFDGSATGNKMLIEPSVFNMGLLLPPSLAFLQRLKEIVPPDSDIVMSTLTSFLDEFLVNVFHPQLEETLTDLSAQTMIELDSFQQDPEWQKVARKPVYKSATAFLNLITAFCKMLDTLPPDQAFSQLIIGQMMTYFDKCYGHYKTLASRADANSQGGIRFKTSAGLVENGVYAEILTKLWSGEGTDKMEALNQAVAFLIQDIDSKPLEDAEKISDQKVIRLLCLMYTSLKWLASKIGQLRHITTSSSDSSQLDQRSTSRRWTLVDPAKQADEESPIYLPMTSETVIQFDRTLDSFHELAFKVLFTLHTEIRGHIILNLRSSIHSSYILPQPAADPDPSILALNTTLVIFDETISSCLRDKEHTFLATGLAHLLSLQFINLLRKHVTALNDNGANLLRLTLQILQQNLKNIEQPPVGAEIGPPANLSHAIGYIELFLSGSDRILRIAKETGGKGMGFSLEELETLIQLRHSEAMTNGPREEAQIAKRKMGQEKLSLSEYLWQM
ncbi:MAG: hypothetical protein M1814_004397 [Vezdaea aestivalis]|nr:MAG: hypothetical protein M1814_004397 [Vezdaea aestivalis]